MDEPVHHCLQMAGIGFRYVWKPEHGWGLYQDNLFLDGNYNYCVSCDWCGNSLDFIDHRPPADKIREHRCIGVWRAECHYRKQGIETQLAIIWDGYEWTFLNNENKLNTRLKKCPYCAAELANLQNYRNEVAIE
jgi:hypothetical protein